MARRVDGRSNFIPQRGQHQGRLYEFMRRGIDWELLAQQKESLLRIRERLSLTRQEQEDLDGIIHLLDGLQDQAVEIGIPSRQVFPEPLEPEPTIQCNEDLLREQMANMWTWSGPTTRGLWEQLRETYRYTYRVEPGIFTPEGEPHVEVPPEQQFGSVDETKDIFD